MIKKYRKKPVIIEAIQFDGANNFSECCEFLGVDPDTYEYTDGCTYIDIPTLEGTMTCTIGKFIIKGIKGEFYPCDEYVFRTSYEEI